MGSVLVGMFDSQSEATQAHSNLMAAGFASSAVAMTGGTAMVDRTTGTTAQHTHEGGISGWFKSLFGDDDTDNASYTNTYEEAFRRGGYGVSVTAASDSEMEKAEKILNDSGAVDIDERAESWRKDGWTGGAVGAMGATGTTASNLQAGATRKLQEVEEELKVGKRAVARGGVRVFTRVTEVPVSETVRLREEHADVKRTAVDRPATEADLAAFEEGSIEVREMAEEAVVSKTARVTGEVEVGKVATEREETISDTVRKTKVDVEQLDGGDMRSPARDGYAESAGSMNRDPMAGQPGSRPAASGTGVRVETIDPVTGKPRI